MIKPGICTFTQYTRCPKILRARLLKAYSLIDQVRFRSDAITMFEELIRDFRLSSGVYRTTFRNRLLELDGAVNLYLKQKYPADTPLVVHDWAASDCITAGEWALSLEKLFPNLQFCASDKMLFLVHARSLSGETIIGEADGTPLQYIRPPFVISFVHRDAAFWIVNAWVRRGAIRAAKRLQVVFPSNPWNQAGTPDRRKLDGWSLDYISLVHPEFQALMHADRRITLEIHSIFDALAKPVDIIRTMNILNPKIMGIDRLQASFRAVRESLIEGGIWIVGGEGDSIPKTNATLYRKSGSRFFVDRRFGRGYAGEQFVAGLD